MELCQLILAVVLKDYDEWEENSKSVEYTEQEWSQNFKNLGAADYLQEIKERTKDNNLVEMIDNLEKVFQENIQEENENKALMFRI